MTFSTGPIYVYLAEVSALEDPGLFETLCAEMPERRRERIRRYRQLSDRCLSLGAGLLLERGLGRYGFSGEDVILQPGGKPALPEGSGLYFNLSHAGRLVLCVTADQPLGCDIEPVREEHLSLVRRVLTPAEQAALERAGSPEERRELFYRFWVLKESYMKYTGRGLALDPGKLSFSLEPEPVLEEAPCGPAVFTELSSPVGYRAALCSRERAETVYEELPAFTDWRI